MYKCKGQVPLRRRKAVSGTLKPRMNADGRRYRLPSITDNYLDIYGLDKLKKLLDGKTSAIVIEKEYFDKDYRDTFSNYHSKRFNTPKSRCVRLHFFKENPYSETNRCLKTDSIYLGYSVIRPTRPNSVGRTLNNYQELNPFEITQLIEGYSIGRIYPSSDVQIIQEKVI